MSFESHLGHRGTKCLLVMIDCRKNNCYQLIVHLQFTLTLCIRTWATMWLRVTFLSLAKNKCDNYPDTYTDSNFHASTIQISCLSSQTGVCALDASFSSTHGIRLDISAYTFVAKSVAPAIVAIDDTVCHARFTICLFGFGDTA